MLQQSRWHDVFQRVQGSPLKHIPHLFFVNCSVHSIFLFADYELVNNIFKVINRLSIKFLLKTIKSLLQVGLDSRCCKASSVLVVLVVCMSLTFNVQIVSCNSTEINLSQFFQMLNNVCNFTCNNTTDLHVSVLKQVQTGLVAGCFPDL